MKTPENNRTRMSALRTIHRVRWVTLGALTTLWLGACSGDGGSTGPKVPATPEGNYALSTIESKPLPFSMFADTGYTLDIISGTIAITANGKWVSKITSRETVAGYASTYIDSTFGTWTAANGAATLLNTETQATASATWTATEVTINEVNAGLPRKVVYRKS